MEATRTNGTLRLARRLGFVAPLFALLIVPAFAGPAGAQAPLPVDGRCTTQLLNTGTLGAYPTFAVAAPATTDTKWTLTAAPTGAGPALVYQKLAPWIASGSAMWIGPVDGASILGKPRVTLPGVYEYTINFWHSPLCEFPIAGCQARIGLRFAADNEATVHVNGGAALNVDKGNFNRWVSVGYCGPANVGLNQIQVRVNNFHLYTGLLVEGLAVA